VRGTGRAWAAYRTVAVAVAWRTAHNALTTPNILIPSLLFPFLFFTAFAGGLSQLARLPGFDFPAGYTAFQFVFVLLQSAAFGGVFTGFGIARDFEQGFSRRLFLAAPHRSAIVVGYGLAALVRWLVTASALTAVALLAGMRVGGDGVDLAALYLLAALVNVAALLWSAGVAVRLRTLQAGPVMQTPVFLALFLAPVYVPLDLLSGWIRAVARANPVTYFLEAGRALVAGQPTHVAAAFAAASVLALVFSAWAFRGLRRAEAGGAAS
jgi:ABC-2 type transport system permease protein